MAAEITTRTLGDSPKNAPLTNSEVDTNFINLKDEISTVEGSIESVASDAALVLAIALG